MRVNMELGGMGKPSELLADDLELLLREINDFAGASSVRREEIPKILEDYLLYVAKTGNTVFPWQHIRPLFRWKLQMSIAAFSGEPLIMETTVYERFDSFRSAPFTIQRLSELITEPKKHYKVKDKFLFALEKAVYVVSTVEPTSPDDEAEINGAAPENNASGDGDHHNIELNSTFSTTPSAVENFSIIGETAASFPLEVTPNTLPVHMPVEVKADLPMDSPIALLAIETEEIKPKETNVEVVETFVDQGLDSTDNAVTPILPLVAFETSEILRDGAGNTSVTESSIEMVTASIPVVEVKEIEKPQDEVKTPVMESTGRAAEDKEEVEVGEPIIEPEEKEMSV